MKGKAEDVHVGKKELFIEAEELLRTTSSYENRMLRQQLEEEMEQYIIKPTDRSVDDDEFDDKVIKVTDHASDEDTKVEIANVMGEDGRMKRVRRMSRVVKVPTFGQPKKKVVKKIVRKVVGKDGVERVEVVSEVAASEQEKALHDQAGRIVEAVVSRSQESLVRQASETIVNAALHGAKKTLSDESLP